MNGRIDHVGIVVADIDAAAAMYRAIFDLRSDPPLENAAEGVRLLFLRADEGATLELVSPTRADTGVARYLERRGEGMHHICFEVDDITAEIERLAQAGYEVLDREPRRGVHGERLAFIHPRSTRGVLIELYEKGSRHT